MTQEQNDKSTSVFPATVVYVIDAYSVAINRGSVHNVEMGQRFIIYAVSSDEIIDPETGEGLGYLEIVRGTGRVVHLQERMATIESEEQTQNKTLRKSNFMFGDTVESVEKRRVPFEAPGKGDKARPI